MPYDTLEEREQARQRLLDLLSRIREDQANDRQPDAADLTEFVRLAEDLLRERPEALEEVAPFLEQIRSYIQDNTH